MTFKRLLATSVLSTAILATGLSGVASASNTGFKLNVQPVAGDTAEPECSDLESKDTCDQLSDSDRGTEAADVFIKIDGIDGESATAVAGEAGLDLDAPLGIGIDCFGICGDDTAEPECSDLESKDTCDQFSGGDASTAGDVDRDDDIDLIAGGRPVNGVATTDVVTVQRH